MTDINTLIDNATAKGTFSVLDAIKGRSYPQDQVTVYTDEAAAYRVHRLNEINSNENDAAAHEEQVRQIEELKESVKGSALTFRMRGIGSAVKKSVHDEAMTKFGAEEFDEAGNWIKGGDRYNEGGQWSDDKILAEHIISVTDAAGNVDDHHWSVGDVEALREWLPDQSLTELKNLVRKLSFTADYFDASVTPDFS